MFVRGVVDWLSRQESPGDVYAMLPPLFRMLSQCPNRESLPKKSMYIEVDDLIRVEIAKVEDIKMLSHLSSIPRKAGKGVPAAGSPLRPALTVHGSRHGKREPSSRMIIEMRPVFWAMYFQTNAMHIACLQPISDNIVLLMLSIS